MIIIEGPDGGGKSTLIRQLAAELNLPIAPRVVSKDTEAMVDLAAWVDENLAEGFQPVLFDRYRLISEPIYGPILRPQVQNEFTDFGWLYSRLDHFYSIEPFIVYCLPPLGEVEFNTAHDNDNEVVRFKMGGIYKQYTARAAMDFALAPGMVYIWDYTSDDLASQFRVLSGQIRAVLQDRKVA